MLGRGTWSHDGRRRAISKYDSQSILNGPEEISSVNGSHRQCAVQRPRRLPAKLGVYQYRTRRRGAFRSHKGVMYMPVQGEECDGPFARGDGGTVQRSRNRPQVVHAREPRNDGDLDPTRAYRQGSFRRLI